MQDMNKWMIVYERKRITSTSILAKYSSHVAFKNPNDSTFQPKAIMSRSKCNFCEEDNDETTCEVKRNARV